MYPDRLLDMALPYLGAAGISEDVSAHGEGRERLKKIVVSVQDSQLPNLSEIPEEIPVFLR